MAEELLRYRVEFDQSQMEGNLSKLRSAIGNSIGAGVSIGSGAFNSLQSDLIASKQFLGSVDDRYSSLQMARGVTGGALEAGVTAAGMGIPLSVAAASTIGVPATMAGLGAGVSAIGSYGAAAATTAASMAPAMIAQAGSLVTMGATAMMNPYALAAAGSMALAYGVTEVGEGVIEDFRATADTEDILRSAGMSASNARGFSSKAVQGMRSGRMRMSGGETAAILETGLSSGVFKSTMMQNPDKLGKKLVETAEAVRTLEGVLGASLDEAMGILGQGAAAGMSPGATVRTAMTAGSYGASSGLGGVAMMQSARMGANLATNMGISASTGANIAMQSMAGAQYGINSLSPTASRLAGGAQGVAGAAMSGAMQQASFAGVLGADSSTLSGFLSGEMSTGQAIASAGQGMSGQGAAGMFRGMLAADKAKENLSATDMTSFQIRRMSEVMQMLPPGMSSEEARTYAAGVTNNLDLNTTRGRAQAQALGKSLTPGAVLSRITELEARQSNIADASTTWMSGERRKMASLYDETLGRATRAVSGRLDEDMMNVREDMSRWSDKNFRGARELTRMFAPGMVRSEAAESFAFDLPSSMGDPDMVKIVMESNEALGGVAHAEIAKGIMTSENLINTPAERKRQAQITMATNGTGRTKRMQKSKFSRAFGMMTSGKDSVALRKQLAGKTQSEQIDIMMDNMDFLGSGQSGVNVAVAALQETDLFAEANTDSYKFGQLMTGQEDVGLAALGDIDRSRAKGFAESFMAGEVPYAAGIGKTIGSFLGGDTYGGVSGDIGTILRSGGTSTTDRAGVAHQLQAYLASSGEQEFGAYEKLSGMVNSKEMMDLATRLKRENSAEAEKVLSPVTSSMHLRATLGHASKTGAAAATASTAESIAGMGRSVRVGGSTGDAMSELRDSVMASDQANLSALEEIRAAISEERQILQQIMGLPSTGITWKDKIGW